MRLAIAFLVVLVSVAPAAADPGDRAQAVVDALGVDTATATKVRDVVFRYDLDLARLERRRVELRRQLVEAHADEPKHVDLALDDLVANQRALARNEEELITRLRQLLTAKKAAQLLVLLAATEPSRERRPAPVEIDMEQPVTAQTRRDADDLFPPGSDLNAPPNAPLNTPPRNKPCNPFESMHGCRYWK
jgi:hypothetical protein